jgi:hypothetical protein
VDTNWKGIHLKIIKIIIKEEILCLHQSGLNIMNKNEQYQWHLAIQ